MHEPTIRKLTERVFVCIVCGCYQITVVCHH